MEKSILKIVLCNLITLVLSASVYSQDKNKEKADISQVKLIALNTLVSNKAKEVISKEAKEEKVMPPLMKKKVVAKKATFNSKADYITMVDGKAFVKKNGKFLPVSNERVVGGMKVHQSGRVERKDGSASILQEGEAMTMEGTVVKVNQTTILKEQVRTLYETCNTLKESKWKTDDEVGMLKRKSILMNKKMDLVNQKMMVMVEYMENSSKTHQDREEYQESISLLDKAIENTEIDIREIDELMPKEDQN
jgi:hypothetical protein